MSAVSVGLTLLALGLPSVRGFADWMPEAQPFPHYYADDLSDYNFINEMSRNKDEIVLVEFYADWCPHCQQFAPDYERIAEAYKHSGQIRACKIDCASNGKRMCNMFSVKFFPTLLFGYADDFANRAKHKNASRPIEIPSQQIGQTAENITAWLNHQIGGYAQLLPVQQFQYDLKRKLERQTRNAVRRGQENYANMWDIKLATAMALHDMITLLHYDPAGLEVEDGQYSDEEVSPGESRKADLDAALGFLDALCTSFPVHSCRSTFCSMGTFVQSQNTLAIGDRVVIMGMKKARALNGHKGWVVGFNETKEKFVVDMGLIWGKVNMHENNIRRVAQGDGSATDFFSSSEEAWATIEGRYTICHTKWMNFKQGWQSCKGSWAHTRGYTCGLWNLFHALIANAPEDYAPNVLLAIEGFIARFFGCDSCRRHFLEMSENIILLQSKKEAVIWLWEAHNKVNKRVAEQESLYGGDPSFPKVEWPTKHQCPSCYKEGWISGEGLEKGEVYQYLLRYYSPKFQYGRGSSESLKVAHSANAERREEILMRKQALEDERAYYRGFLGTGYSWQFLLEVILIGYLVFTYGYEAYEYLRDKYKAWKRKRKAAKHYL